MISVFQYFRLGSRRATDDATQLASCHGKAPRGARGDHKRRGRFRVFSTEPPPSCYIPRPRREKTRFRPLQMARGGKLCAPLTGNDVEVLMRGGVIAAEREGHVY